MDSKGPRNFDSIHEHETPRLREKFVAKTFKRRSTNLNADNLQRSIQLLEDAVSPSLNTFARTPRPGNLRHSSYTPAPGTPSRLDTSELYTFTSAKKNTLHNDSINTSQNPAPSLSAYKVQSNETVISPFRTMFMDDMTVNDLTFIPDEDHGKRVSGELFESFKNSLKTCAGAPQVLDLISEYKTICDKHVSALAKVGMGVTKNQPKFQKTIGLLDLLQDEKRTWQLVYSLYKDRLEDEAKTDLEMEAMDVQITKPTVWAQSEQNIANKLFEKDSSVRQSQLVVDWLEMCSFDGLSSLPDNAMFFKDEPVAWENTLHHLQKVKKRMSSARDTSVVSEMDPDAPHRQQKTLDNIDESDERRFLRNLFTLLRAGQIEKASELCQNYGQPWRAASLEGWRLLHDPNYEESPDSEGKLHLVEGNFYRDVWKAVCWRMAKETDLDRYERAMYACLSGHLQALLPVCLSWTDYLWAYFKVMVDIHVEQEVRLHKKTSRDLDELPAEFFDQLIEPHEIFKDIEASIKESVSLEAKAWYHVIQKHIILDDVSGLIERMYSWLQMEREWLPAHLVRFMAHLVLFLRSIGHSCKEELCEAIIQTFVEDLIKTNANKNLVAFYVSTLLPPAQVQWYAMFLEGVEDEEERRQCLAWAEEEGLDVAAITKMVVETIRTRDSPSPSALPADSLVPDLVISEENACKINAIDWLVFDENHRPEAIRQANALIRCFVAVKKYGAARQVFNKLPADTIDVIYRLWHFKTGSADLPESDSNAIREYLCMKVYLDAVESFNDWFVLYHQGQPVKPRGPDGGSFADRVALEHRMKQYQTDHDRWMHNLQLQTKTSRDRIYNVLLFPDGGWLVDASEDPDADESRQNQMDLLRRIHLPALCLNLHTILHSSNMHAEAVQIADVVASEVHQLYKVFDHESLQHLLSQIAKSSHSLLNASKDPLGYEIV